MIVYNMPPVIDLFWASLPAQRHMIAKHGVELEEAIEAAESSIRHVRAADGPRGARRYVVPGKTFDGRRLWVVFEHEAQGRGRIITAREPEGDKERARHRRQRGD
jgi:uncharacterized DUF497 family protein